MTDKRNHADITKEELLNNPQKISDIILFQSSATSQQILEKIATEFRRVEAAKFMKPEQHMTIAAQATHIYVSMGIDRILRNQVVIMHVLKEMNLPGSEPILTPTIVEKKGQDVDG